MPSTDPERTPASRALLAFLLALIGAASMLYYHQALFIPRAVEARATLGLGGGYSFGNDFYEIWLTSREWLRHGRDPYSAEMTRAIQSGVYGRVLNPALPHEPIDQRQFAYPAFTDLLFFPLTEFSFPAVRVVLLCALLLLTVGTVPLWLRVFAWQLSWNWQAVILMLTLCSYPALEALYALQVGLVVAFLVAASVLVLQRGRFLLAGILMAVAAIKPQVTILVIGYALLWSLSDLRQRRGYCIGLFATLTLLIGTSLLFLPTWIQSWLQSMVAYRGYNTPPLLIEVLTRPLGAGVAGPVTLLLVAGAMIFAVLQAWSSRKSPPTSLQFLLTVSLLLSLTTIIFLPGQAVYDHLALLPGILLLLRHRKRLRSAGPVPAILTTAGTVVLFWPWVAAFALIVMRPFLSAPQFFSTAVFDLPIRTAASLPFAVLALLLYSRRIMRPAKSEVS